MTSLALAFSPAPLPAPNACSKDYQPVCGENANKEEVTFANLCKLEQSHFEARYTFKHNGTCRQMSTPAPNSLPVELICDNKIITTISEDINITVEHGGDIFKPSLLARTSHPNVAVNPDSIRFINENGEKTTSKYIAQVGKWDIGIEGMITFHPTRNFSNPSSAYLEKNSSISIDYIINNNCDNPKGISQKSTLTVTIIDPSKNILRDDSPWFDTSIYSCFKERPIDAINDIVKMKKNEKIKTISILENDTYLGYPQNTLTHYVFASLRLIDEKNHLKRKINIKNKGTWLADTTAGKVLFVPEPNFTGESSIRYTIHSSCSSHNNKYTDYSQAKITVIAPTPTPCPRTKQPVCGQEKLCNVSPSGETHCLSSIPHNTTYDNICELFNAGDVFLYEGACKKPTPTPTPKVIYIYITPTPTPVTTPTTTPKPTVVTPKEETKPKPPTTTPTDTNTSTSTSKVTSSNGSAFGVWSILMMMLLTVMLVIMDKKRENA